MKGWKKRSQVREERIRMFDLFASLPATEPIGEGAFVFRKAAIPLKKSIMGNIEKIVEKVPFRHMVTPGGRTMSVRMTNCGQWGWVSDKKKGYRYERIDPLSGQSWPAIPLEWQEYATQMAKQAGYPHFYPQACLINHYQVGQTMGLHQDKDEKDLSQPILSISIGNEAVFVFGGRQRKDPVKRIRLQEGDVVVWGGPSRLYYHGISKIIRDTAGPDYGRLCLTFRCV